MVESSKATDSIEDTNSALSEEVEAKRPLLNRMRIGTRVGLSFFTILVIFISVSLFSLDIFSQSKKFFSGYSDVNDEAIAILEIDRQVLELQRLILAFSNTGHSSSIKTAKELHQKLIQNVSAIQQRIDDKERLSLLVRMTEILNSYGENIDSLVEARNLREKLMSVSMVALATRAREVTDQLVDLTSEDGSIAIANKIHLITEQNLKAQVDAVGFFGSRKYDLQRSAKRYLTLAQQGAKTLSAAPDTPPEVKPYLAELGSNIAEYEGVFFQAIQATRGYLFLVNVVMAGEAAEFSTLSQKLKNSTLKILFDLKTTTDERISEAQRTTTLLTLSAIFVGLMLAVLISRSISKPIQDIATTFDRLVSDEDNIEIPGLDRQDEIGHLAKAANIFKDMNQRTKDILKQSQSLSRELQNREIDLENQARELKKSNDELDNFAYVASHDLKSPLRAIDNLSLWISEDCSDVLPEESLDHFNKIRQRVVRMENLLASLLNYSRIGKTEVAVCKMNCAELIQEVVDLIDLPQSFQINVAEGLPDITTAVSPLQQVFQNLFTNGIKYNDKDSGVINVSGKEVDGDLMEFSISDNGPGIEEKYHSRIFQMFQTLQPRDVIESSGMGLAIIKKVIEGYGGTISVESSPGEGATFRFTWPLTMSEEMGTQSVDNNV